MEKISSFKCSECGKEKLNVYSDDYAYILNAKKFCSYKCLQAYKKRHYAKSYAKTTSILNSIEQQNNKHASTNKTANAR